LSLLAPSIRLKPLLKFRRFRRKGIFMLPEASYLSRFFTKFVEIVAGGLATAMCAYLIAHLGGPLSPGTPAPAAVSVASTTGELVAGPPGRQATPVAAAAAEERHRATQPVADAPPPAQPARKAEKAATAVPAAPKDNKAGAGAARSEKSAEALARAALANLDADRPAPADAPIRRNLTATDAAAVEIQPRSADVLPRPADIQPPPAAADTQPRPVATLDLPPPNAASPSELAPPQPESQPHQDKGLFSLLKQMPDLLRPGTPSFAEAPRPPLPVGTPRTE
jgi:hypothetical protein